MWRHIRSEPFRLSYLRRFGFCETFYLRSEPFRLSYLAEEDEEDEARKMRNDLELKHAATETTETMETAESAEAENARLQAEVDNLKAKIDAYVQQQTQEERSDSRRTQWLHKDGPGSASTVCHKQEKRKRRSLNGV